MQSGWNLPIQQTNRLPPSSGCRKRAAYSYIV
jgi:hypothetical protein